MLHEISHTATHSTHYHDRLQKHIKQTNHLILPRTIYKPTPVNSYCNITFHEINIKFNTSAPEQPHNCMTYFAQTPSVVRFSEPLTHMHLVIRIIINWQLTTCHNP